VALNNNNKSDLAIGQPLFHEGQDEGSDEVDHQPRETNADQRHVDEGLPKGKR
jgi:hypothetical protein